MKRSTLVLLMLSLALGLPGLAHGASASAPVAVTVERRQVERIHAADAVIESSQSATISAQINARVQSVHADAGSLVKRGQVLARIDAREADAAVAQAGAQLAQAHAQLVQARQTHERNRELRAQNFISQAAVDASEATLKAAEAAVSAARAAGQQAGTVRSYAEIVAPFDGIIASRSIEAGDLATAGKPLFVLYAPGTLRAVATLPQTLIGGLAHAKVADVDVPALGKALPPGRLTVLPAADALTLAQRIRVELPQPDHALPGMAAKVRLIVGSVERLVLPAASVIHRGELTAVQVVRAEGAPALRQVRLGESFAGDWIEVLAGVQAGESVLVSRRAP